MVEKAIITGTIMARINRRQTVSLLEYARRMDALEGPIQGLVAEMRRSRRYWRQV